MTNPYHMVIALRILFKKGYLKHAAHLSSMEIQQLEDTLINYRQDPATLELAIAIAKHNGDLSKATLMQQHLRHSKKEG